MLCICRLWVVVLNVSDVFVVAGLQITTRLSYIRVVAGVAFQLVNARTIVWWGFCFGCFLIMWASVLLLLNAIFIPVFLSRLLTFLICGDEKVNVAHFSLLVGCVG